MARNFRPNLPHRLRKEARFALAFCWVSGLICGIWVFLTADTSLFFMMRSIPTGALSIVSLLCVTALPFLLSIFMVSISRPFLILPLCFCKALLFSFVSLGIIQVFGSAGWLFQHLLLFSDCAAVPILYLYWLRNMSGANLTFSWETVFFLALGCLSGSVDYRIIMPLLAHLIDF